MLTVLLLCHYVNVFEIITSIINTIIDCLLKMESLLLISYFLSYLLKTFCMIKAISQYLFRNSHSICSPCEHSSMTCRFRRCNARITDIRNLTLECIVNTSECKEAPIDALYYLYYCSSFLCSKCFLLFSELKKLL